jgi:hypothetical protein
MRDAELGGRATGRRSRRDVGERIRCKGASACCACQRIVRAGARNACNASCEQSDTDRAGMPCRPLHPCVIPHRRLPDWRLVYSTEVRSSRQRGKRAFEVERLRFVRGGFGKSAAPATLPP